MGAIYESYKTLKVFEAFSGYGSQSIALRNLGIPHEVVAISEIDKYAIQAYEAIHGPTLNLGDISKIKVEDIPQHDLFTYSFPCQDLSVAGKQSGLIRGQTRSGLLYECERIIEHCKPKYLLLENVKNLVGKKFKPQFDEWLEYLEGLGYTNYWKVLNAKDYGIPQNRERVFVVSILGEHRPYEFPKPISLDRCIKDVLEDEVDEKYYLSDEALKKFKPSKNLTQKADATDKDKILDVGFIKKSEEGKKHQSNTVIHEDYLMRTLTACDWKSPQLIITNEINQIGMLDIKGNEQIRRVYGDNGISPTLNTMQGGNRQPKILIPQATKKGYIEMEVPGICDLSYPGSKTRRGRVQEEGKICPTLTAARQDICYVERTPKIICEQRSDEGLRFFKDNVCGTIRTINSGGDKRVIELPCIAASRGRNPNNPSSRVAGEPTEQRLEYNTKGTSNTITTVQKDNYVVEQTYRIRKLTPRECFRLMGMSDDDIDKIQQVGISNTQQYKMAGNSIVVDVLEAIFKNLF